MMRNCVYCSSLVGKKENICESCGQKADGLQTYIKRRNYAWLSFIGCFLIGIFVNWLMAVLLFLATIVLINKTIKRGLK